MCGTVSGFGGEAVTTSLVCCGTSREEIAITGAAAVQDRMLGAVGATNRTVRVTISDGTSSVNSSGSTSPAGNISLTINTSSLSGVDLTAKIEQKRVVADVELITGACIREEPQTTRTITERLPDPATASR